MKKDSPKALNDDGEEAIVDESPATELKAPEEATETESTEEVKEEETGESSKKGYSQRVRELVTEKKQAIVEKEEALTKAKSLEERIAELTAPVEPRYPAYQPPQEEPIVAAGEEIDTLELDKRLKAREQRILQQADAMADIKSKQSEAINRINNEAAEVMRTYSQLDPESKDFDRELSDSVNDAVEAHIMARPYTASVKKIVEKQMRPYQRALTKEVGKVTENIAKQVSETALRPTSVRQPEKKTEDMSIQELEDKLGVVNS